jgi:hypothetical protein
MRRNIVGLLAVALVCVCGVASANITYIVNQTIGPGTATGFITTDGTIGTLGTADLLSWNLLVNDGTNATDLTSAAGYTNVIGGSLVASALNLTFNYGAGGEWYIVNTTDGAGELCYDAGGNCFGFPGEGFYNVGGDGKLIGVPLGNPLVGSVPEPGTFTLLSLALACLGFARGRSMRHHFA